MDLGIFAWTADFGPYSLTAVGDYDIFVEKVSSSGTVQWAMGMGDGNDERTSGIAVDGAGNIYVTGLFNLATQFGPYTLIAAGGTDIFVTKLRGCGTSFIGDPTYGSLLFPPLCTRNASELTQDVYNSKTLGIWRGAHSILYLSSDSTRFAPLVVDDAVHINGLDSGLGPYSYQPSVPPFLYDVPIEQNLQPLDAHAVTELIPAGESSVLFELVDTQREIYGNTAVYLLRDCGILMDATPTRINFVSHDDQVTSRAPEFDVRYGLLSNLRADRSFLRITCLGHFYDTPATVTLAVPPLGDGYYFLARGISSASCYHYGDSTLDPDPRDPLASAPQCP